MYLSHRSPEFLSILENTVLLMKEVMNIPSNYEVLFTHGGGHGQFAAVPLNLCPTGTEKATYLVNGTWSARAAIEAKKYSSPIVISSQNPDGTFTSNPPLDDIDPESAYVYLCSNETVNGIEMHRLPDLKSRGIDAPLVIDASSDFTTKPIDWEKYNVGVLYACASKNIGHPGLTACVIRKDLIGNANPLCPGVFDYKLNIDGGNVWNTCATFNIEVVGIVMDWILSNGGVEAMEELSIKKSQLVYDLIESSDGFYSTPLASDDQKPNRSRMNVPFDVMGGEEAMTEKFVKEAWDKGIVGLRTLTPFGVGRYLRASLYHGVSLESTEFLVEFMTEFMNNNR
jgi:phosphoserine aminotransferase